MTLPSLDSCTYYTSEPKQNINDKQPNQDKKGDSLGELKLALKKLQEEDRVVSALVEELKDRRIGVDEFTECLPAAKILKKLKEKWDSRCAACLVHGLVEKEIQLKLLKLSIRYKYELIKTILHKKRPLSCFDMEFDKSTMLKSRKNLPKNARQTLKKWFRDHFSNPFPTYKQKQELARLCDMSTEQITTWFINERSRNVAYRQAREWYRTNKNPSEHAIHRMSEQMQISFKQLKDWYIRERDSQSLYREMDM